MFFEDVQGFLNANHIRYTLNLGFIGNSKLPTQYDFAIPKSDIMSERLISTVQSLNKTALHNIIFTWTDTKDVRPYNSELYKKNTSHLRLGAYKTKLKLMNIINWFSL